MSSVVRVEYVDLSTDLVPNEILVTGDSLKVESRKDQRAEIEVEAGDEGVSILGGELSDTIIGGEGNDSINGSLGNDVLEGIDGNDTLVGGSGNDTIVGGLGSDSLVGGFGNDVITVTSGDSVRSGTGEDVITIDLSEGFDTAELPVITDFEPGEDQIAIAEEDDSSTGPVDDVSYDPKTGTLIVEGQAAVKVGEDVTLTASDIDFSGNEGDLSIVDTGATKVYEFLNSSEDISFYTVDENEKAFIEENLSNYVLQEEGGFSSVDPISGSEVEEVHRFFNTKTGTHLYTTDEVEKDYILENLEDYSYEDVKFYGYSSEIDGSMPIYRFYDSAEGVHMFTHSGSEMEEMASDGMLDNEGIAFYAMPSDDSATAAI
ncbi:MAG: hypothetical protein AAFO95_22455 [Cyanobacteria bacterium J06600_6]